MAKLIVLISVLLAVIANAFAHRTIITTVEIDEANPRGREQSCVPEVQMRDLSACEQYIRQSRSEVLARHGVGKQQDPQLRRCCNQLRQVRNECQCQALRSVVEEQIQGQRQEYQTVMQKARNIPSECGLSERCDFGTIMF